MGWFYGFMVYKVKPVSFGVKTYSVLSSGTDARQFLLLEQATWTCYGCGLSLCSQLVSARQFLLLEQAIWS